ncbi:hypothetical protein F4801DRAFT_585647 [Xylaria longipes]|nr:hypothetical protein F4801DRAFT_585647 [Xylaria longipes]RYC57796.1 hypothetical protein CHU98_g8411 [Xylaria longipes]
MPAKFNFSTLQKHFNLSLSHFTALLYSAATPSTGPRCPVFPQPHHPPSSATTAHHQTIKNPPGAFVDVCGLQPVWRFVLHPRSHTRQNSLILSRGHEFRVVWPTLFLLFSPSPVPPAQPEQAQLPPSSSPT